MRRKQDYHGKLLTTGVLVLCVALACAVASTAEHSNATGNAARISASPIPIGTILPAKLKNTFSVEEVVAGQSVGAEIAQEVPLPNRQKIRLHAAVQGKVTAVTKSADGSGLEVSLRFDGIEDDKQIIPVVTSLRAIAAYQAVIVAQTPLGGTDVGTPAGWANTVQIGGDRRYGDGGEVRNRKKQKVGKGVSGGVLVHVSAPPDSGCEGPVNGDDRLQALWVFSANACGVYDLKGVEIAHNGKTDPAGEITLRFENGKTKLEAGAGILLRTVGHQ